MNRLLPVTLTLLCGMALIVPAQAGPQRPVAASQLSFVIAQALTPVAPEPTNAIHPNDRDKVLDRFGQWYRKLYDTEQALATNKALRVVEPMYWDAVKYGKFNTFLLVLHSEYKTVLARQEALLLKVNVLEFQTKTAEAVQWAKTRAKDKNPNAADGDFATSSAGKELQKLLREYAALTSTGDPEYVRLTQLYETTRAAVNNTEKQLNTSLLTAQKMPGDGYAGKDKNALRQLVAAEWKSEYPQDQVLAIRFYDANWEKIDKMVWNAGNKAYNRDHYSILPARVLVKAGSDTVSIYWAYVNKLHLQGNKLTVRALRNAKPDQMLLKDVKP